MLFCSEAPVRTDLVTQQGRVHFVLLLREGVDHDVVVVGSRSWMVCDMLLDPLVDWVFSSPRFQFRRPGHGHSGRSSQQ